MPPVPPLVHRGRGRPFGSNKKQKLPLTLTLIANSIGGNLQRRATADKGATKRSHGYGTGGYGYGKASLKVYQNSFLQATSHSHLKGNSCYNYSGDPYTPLSQYSDLDAVGIDAALIIIEATGKRMLKSDEEELLAQLRKWGPVVDLVAAVTALKVQKESVLQR